MPPSSFQKAGASGSRATGAKGAEAVERERLSVFAEEALPHSGSLYRAALQLARDPDVAEDLVQETFCEAWASFSRYRPGTNCKGWLFRILFRVRSRHLRLVQRLHEEPLDEAPPICFEAAGFEGAVEARLMLDVLESLPEHYRMVLVLADIEGLSYREVAQILEIPIGTVMSRLNRARRLLRRKLVSRAKSIETARTRVSK